MHNGLVQAPSSFSRIAGNLLLAVAALLSLGASGVFARSMVLGLAAAVPAPIVDRMHDIDPAKHAPSRVITMEVTAYCPCTRCCGPAARGVTASGKHVSYNDGKFVAADTRKLPFGTKVLVPGYGDGQPVEVIDRGGAIKGDKLDVFFPTHEAALKWGRKKVQVTLSE